MGSLDAGWPGAAHRRLRLLSVLGIDRREHTPVKNDYFDLSDSL
jgi:hypothetical protein